MSDHTVPVQIRHRENLPGRLGRCLGVLVLGLGLALSAIADDARTSVFTVTGGDTALYLGGTVHLLRESDYPLPPQYDRAYEASEVMYFETDIAALNDMSMQSYMMQQLTYQDGRSLSSVLNEEAYEALSGHVDEVGLPMAMLENFKPGLLVSMLSVLEFQRLGFTPEGVDMYFHTRAAQDGKPIRELESVQDQIDMLARMGEGNESAFVLYSLEDLQHSGESIERIVSSWRSGDMDDLNTVFVEDMREQAPEDYQRMMVDRNHSWLSTIEAAIENGESAFVLVGTGHLVGEDGLVTLLREQGYTVEPLR